MKTAILLLFGLTIYSTHGLGQLRDSISVHQYKFSGTWSESINGWQAIRKIDSSGYANYKLNSKFFGKVFRNDSLYIFLKDNHDNDSTPASLLIGEYTTKDSIHFIDFMDSIKFSHIGIQNITGRYISRNQLPELKEITVGSNKDLFRFVSCDLYIIIDSGFVAFHLDKTEFPGSVRNSLMKLRKGGSIIMDNVKILCPDGSIRSVIGSSYLISE